MSELKMQQMVRVYDLKKHLRDAVIELTEEGYSEIEIKAYIKEMVSQTNEFIEEYLALWDLVRIFR